MTQSGCLLLGSFVSNLFCPISQVSPCLLYFRFSIFLSSVSLKVCCVSMGLHRFLYGSSYFPQCVVMCLCILKSQAWGRCIEYVLHFLAHPCTACVQLTCLTTCLSVVHLLQFVLWAVLSVHCSMFPVTLYGSTVLFPPVSSALMSLPALLSSKKWMVLCQSCLSGRFSSSVSLSCPMSISV